MYMYSYQYRFQTNNPFSSKVFSVPKMLVPFIPVVFWRQNFEDEHLVSCIVPYFHLMAGMKQRCSRWTCIFGIQLKSSLPPSHWRCKLLMLPYYYYCKLDVLASFYHFYIAWWLFHPFFQGIRCSGVILINVEFLLKFLLCSACVQYFILVWFYSVFCSMKLHILLAWFLNMFLS